MPLWETTRSQQERGVPIETRPGTHPRSPLRLPGAGVLPLFLLVVIWLLALSHYSRLPSELPSRFIPWGVPVSWAPKSPALFVLPGTALLIELVLRFVGMLAIARPVVDGKALEGAVARAVGRLLERYLFLMRTALLAWLLNLEFRIIQIAYGTRVSLGWDSYLVAAMVAVYGVAGAWLLLRGARRLAALQSAEA